MGRVGAAGSGTRSWERQGRGSQRSGPGLRAQPSAGRRVWGAPWLLPVVGGEGSPGLGGEAPFACHPGCVGVGSPSKRKALLHGS